MAYDPLYQNQLKGLLTDPSSFSLSPDAQVGMKYGLQGVNASNSATRGSGGALAALTKYGVDQSQQDYGNQVNRLASLMGQAQNYDLGQGQNQNVATRNANDLALGTQQNANTRYGIDQSTGLGYFNGANNFALGVGGLVNNATRNANDYSLGQGQNANTAQNNWFNYDLGQGRNANDAAATFASYDLGQGRNAIDWYNAGTNRGQAQTQGYNQNQQNQVAWYKAQPRSGVTNTGGLWYDTGGH